MTYSPAARLRRRGADHDDHQRPRAHGHRRAQVDTDTIDVWVEPVNDAPVSTPRRIGITYTENDPATPIDPGMLVTTSTTPT
jgi:hypothetical protein